MAKSYSNKSLWIVILFFCVFSGCEVQELSSSNESDAEVLSERKIQASSEKQNSHVYIGTGSVQGVYFPIGGVICRLLNRKTYIHRIRCTLESTGGSVYNLRQLREGNFDIVFAQSDWQFNAYEGISTFEKDKPNPNLRAVFALEADPLALIVRQDSEIESFDDLQNRVVSFGYARALQNRIIDDLLKVKKWTSKNFKQIKRINDNQQISEVCSSNVDAVLLLSSSLNDHLKDLDEGCKLKFIAIEGAEVDELVKSKPYYRKSYFSKGEFLDSPKKVSSFGLGATFVAQESTSPKVIYHVVKEVVENFNDFKSLHPSLKKLNKKELPFAGISVPLHPGAIRYYEEIGLLK